MNGGRSILTNADLLKRAEEIARHTKFIELGGKPDFQDTFVENMALPPLVPDA